MKLIIFLKCASLVVHDKGLCQPPGEPLVLQLVGGRRLQTSQGAQTLTGKGLGKAQRRWDEMLCQGACNMKGTWFTCQRYQGILHVYTTLLLAIEAQLMIYSEIPDFEGLSMVAALPCRSSEQQDTMALWFRHLKLWAWCLSEIAYENMHDFDFASSKKERQ